MKVLFTLILTFFFNYAFTQGCTITTSNLTEISGDDGSGNCVYSIDLLFIEGQGPDNGTLTFSSSSATILTGGGPHTCACSGNTYPITFEAACGSMVSFTAEHDNSGNGNDCSVSVVGISLPVKWLAFNLQNDQNGIIDIFWSTAIEINNDYFELEYSLDGVDFDYVATIKGSGNTSKQTDYSYAHRHNNESKIYYRIKQVDYDGNFSYSEIKDILLKQNNSFTISPNPVQDVLNISSRENEIIAHIFDFSGTRILTTTKTQIDIRELKPGLYTILLEEGNASKSKQFVVTN